MNKKVYTGSWNEDALHSGRDEIESDPQNDPVDERTESLVEYLEGDLSPEQKASLEVKLAQDCDLRNELDQLKASWDMLDALETKVSSPGLTRSTMEMVALFAEEEIRTLKRRARRNWLLARLFLLVILGVAVWLGFLLVSFFVLSPSQRITQDRSLLNRLDKLETVGDYDLLVQLKETGWFNRSFVHTPEGSSAKVNKVPNDVPTIESYNRISVSTTQNGSGTGQSELDRELGRQAARFFRMSSSKQKELRALNDKIEQSPQSKELLIVLDRYYFWYRNRLHEMERDLIETTPLSSRITRIKSIYSRRQQQWYKEFGNMFPFRQSERDSSGRGAGQAGIPELYSFGFFKDDLHARGNRWMKNMLPQELQHEDFGPLRKKFHDFCHGQFEKKEKQRAVEAPNVAHERTSSQREGQDGPLPGEQKRSEGSGEYRRGFRLVHEFLMLYSPEELITLFSGQGQKYLRSLSPKNQKAIFGFILSFYLPGGEDHLPNRNRRTVEAFAGSDHSRFAKLPGQGVTGWTPNESTKELAQTLRRLPQSVRDELLSLPSDEMYGRLLAIHWGFDSRKPGLPGKGPERSDFRGSRSGPQRFFEGDKNPLFGPGNRNSHDIVPPESKKPTERNSTPSDQ